MNEQSTPPVPAPVTPQPPPDDAAPSAGSLTLPLVEPPREPAPVDAPRVEPAVAAKRIEAAVEMNRVEPSVEAQRAEAPRGAVAVEDTARAGRAARIGGLLITLAILLTLAWSLCADRYTPYTSQARVGGYVIGIAPKVAGLVTQMWVVENQVVTAGDRLFEIDPAQYRIALDKARADLENARKQVGAGNAAVDVARAQLRAARANQRKAEQDASRLTRLREDDPGTISLRRLEIAQATLAQAQAQVAAAEADVRRAIEQMGGDDAASNTVLQTALTAVAKAELDLTNTVVTAPSRGLVTDLRADVGRFAGAGNAVLTLIAIHDVWIDAEYTENNLGHLHVDTPVEIVLDVLPGRVFHGRVRSISRGVGSGGESPAGSLPTVKNDRDWLRQAQRFPVRIAFDPAQDAELRRHLRIGGQASVIAYAKGPGILHRLGRAWIRLMSWFSYAY